MSTGGDFSELFDFGRDLGITASEVESEVRKSMRQTAFTVRDGWRDYAQSYGPRLKHYPNTIDFDIHSDHGAISADIGPNRERYGGQANLAHIIEHGGVYNAPKGGDIVASDIAEDELPDRIARAEAELRRRHGL